MNSNSRKIGSRTSLFLRFYSISLFFYYLFAFLVLKGLEFDWNPLDQDYMTNKQTAKYFSNSQRTFTWMIAALKRNLCLHLLLSTMTETSYACSNKTILLEVIYVTEGQWIEKSARSFCLSFAWQRCRSISALWDLAYVAVISTISYHYSKEKYPAKSLM